jgi:mono/diheme cytochrome c family protein
MKKTITLSFIALAVFACSRKTVSTTTTTTPQVNEGTKMETPANEKAKVETPKTTTVDLTAQGKNVYTNSCGRCHGLKPVENYTESRWTEILKSMIPKARLNDTEAQQVTAYVMANAKK